MKGKAVKTIGFLYAIYLLVACGWAGFQYADRTSRSTSSQAEESPLVRALSQGVESTRQKVAQQALEVALEINFRSLMVALLLISMGSALQRLEDQEEREQNREILSSSEPPKF